MKNPSDYVDRICNGLMDGKSLRQLCGESDMPDRATVFRWMADNEEFATKCARARGIQAHAVNDDISELEDKTASGELDPAAARVVIASKQWRAAKLLPKVYGEKLDVNHSGTIDLATRLAAARERTKDEA